MHLPILAAAVFSVFLAQGDETLRIESPAANAAVSGMVEIRGTAAVAGMTRYRADFAYAQNPTGTHFPIADATAPVQRGVLAEWDTSAVSEGTYSLRLTAYQADGSSRNVVVENIRVRRTAASAPTPAGEIVIPFQPDAQTSGRAAAFPAPTAVFASGSPSVPAHSDRLIAFFSGAGLALAAIGLFRARSLALEWKHRRFVASVRKNESNHG
jgi:hypothetical protein